MLNKENKAPSTQSTNSKPTLSKPPQQSSTFINQRQPNQSSTSHQSDPNGNNNSKPLLQRGHSTIPQQSGQSASNILNETSSPRFSAFTDSNQRQQQQQSSTARINDRNDPRFQTKFQKPNPSNIQSQFPQRQQPQSLFQPQQPAQNQQNQQQQSRQDPHAYFQQYIEQLQQSFHQSVERAQELEQTRLVPLYNERDILYEQLRHTQDVVDQLTTMVQNANEFKSKYGLIEPLHSTSMVDNLHNSLDINHHHHQQQQPQQQHSGHNMNNVNNFSSMNNNNQNMNMTQSTTMQDTDLVSNQNDQFGNETHSFKSPFSPTNSNSGQGNQSSNPNTAIDLTDNIPKQSTTATIDETSTSKPLQQSTIKSSPNMSKSGADNNVKDPKLPTTSDSKITTKSDKVTSITNQNKPTTATTTTTDNKSKR